LLFVRNHALEGVPRHVERHLGRIAGQGDVAAGVFDLRVELVPIDFARLQGGSLLGLDIEDSDGCTVMAW